MWGRPLTQTLQNSAVLAANGERWVSDEGVIWRWACGGSGGKRKKERNQREKKIK
jgi:hypothetical protein